MIARVCLTLLLSLGSAFSQEMYTIKLQGTGYTTNAAGEFTASQVDTVSILKEAAGPGGPELSRMALVYHVNGSDFGDTIDVIDTRTGAKLDWVYGFFFGEDRSLGRAALTNAPGTLVHRVDYIYTKQSPYAQGSAFVVKRKVRRGGEWHLRIEGKMQFLIRPEDRHAARMRELTLTTVGPFKPVP